MNHNTKIFRSGNSSAVRLPKAIMKELCLFNGDQVTISVSRDGAIVIKKESKKYPSIIELFQDYEKTNHTPSEWDVGVNVGMEKISHEE